MSNLINTCPFNTNTQPFTSGTGTDLSPDIVAPAYSIHPLTDKDAEKAHGISTLKEIGWRTTLEEWKKHIHLSNGFAFGVIENGSNQLVATAIAIHFNLKTRVLDVLVHPQHQKKGLGSWLFHHLINEIDSKQPAFLELEASPIGKNLYEKCGFKLDYEIVSFYANLKDQKEISTNSTAIQECSINDLDLVARLDEEAFGSSRKELLKTIDRVKNRIFVDKRDGEILGFLICSEEEGGLRIGPWVHKDSEKSLNLFKTAIKEIRTKFPSHNLSVHTANRVTICALEALGFQKQSSRSFHMHRGNRETLPLPNNAIYYSIADFGVG